MELTQQQLQDVHDKTGMPIENVQREIEFLAEIMGEIGPEKMRELRNWFVIRNRAIENIKQQPFFEVK